MIHRKSQLSVPKTRNPYIRHSIYCKPYYILGSVLSFIHACGGFPGASRPFQEAPGFQGPPGASRALQGPQGPPEPSAKTTPSANFINPKAKLGTQTLNTNPNPYIPKPYALNPIYPGISQHTYFYPKPKKPRKSNIST